MKTICVPPWYKNRDLIPEVDRQDALRKFASDDAELVSRRMRSYESWRAGWSTTVREFHTNFMYTHDEAVELALKLIVCTHDWVLERHFDETKSNPVYRTGSRGHVNRCSRCDATDRVVTSHEYYAGD